MHVDTHFNTITIQSLPQVSPTGALTYQDLLLTITVPTLKAHVLGDLKWHAVIQDCLLSITLPTQRAPSPRTPQGMSSYSRHASVYNSTNLKISVSWETSTVTMESPLLPNVTTKWPDIWGLSPDCNSTDSKNFANQEKCVVTETISRL